MSGPVWRFERDERGWCDLCCREARGLYVEGQVADNLLHPQRRVCQSCYQASAHLVVAGEAGKRRPGPAYVARG